MANDQRNKLRVVALADSLALPRDDRPDGDLIKWENTWPYQLEQKLVTAGIRSEVINCGKRQRTIESVIDDFYEHVELKAPHVLILQVGIVDASPRIFTRFESKLINILPASMRNWVICNRSKNRKKIVSRAPLKKVYVRPKRFRELIVEFRERVFRLPSQPHVFLVPIIYNPMLMEQKSPGYSGNIQIYNKMLQECTSLKNCEMLDVHPESDWFCQDGYHLTEMGNERIAAIVNDRIVNSVRQNDELARVFSC